MSETIETGCGHRILLVEDDALIAQMYRVGLELAGFGVVVACDGESALRIVRDRDDSDVVILDLTLPGIDGLEVLAALHNSPATSEIPVIVLSNRTEDFATANAAGAVRCLMKAATAPGQLVDSIRSLVRTGARTARRERSRPASMPRAHDLPGPHEQGRIAARKERRSLRESPSRDSPSSTTA